MGRESKLGETMTGKEVTHWYVDNLIATHIALVVETMPRLSASDARTEERDDTYAAC